LQRKAQICDMNIAHALTRGMGWGSLAFEPADEGKGVKHLLTPGAPDFSRGAAHCGDLPRSGGKIFEEFL
jgi:hypothetical protein